MAAHETNPADEAPYSTGFQENGSMRARWSEPPDTIVPYGYLTPQAAFGDAERGSPLPYTLPRATRLAVGLERETWRLEVVADPDSDARLDHPLSIAAGTALDFAGLLTLGERHGVQFLKGMTCNNLGEPLGMGLWEGVPLREVVWLQEEPQNMGAWSYIAPKLREVADPAIPIVYVGRPESASPAEGSLARHTIEQHRIITAALQGSVQTSVVSNR